MVGHVLPCDFFQSRRVLATAQDTASLVQVGHTAASCGREGLGYEIHLGCVGAGPSLLIYVSDVVHLWIIPRMDIKNWIPRS